MRLFLFIALVAFRAAAAEIPDVLIVAGAGGNDEYAATFATAAGQWAKAAAAGHHAARTLGLDPTEANPREAFRAALREAAGGKGDLWLVLIGHGTFDGQEARFNLRGDDFTAGELDEWIRPIERPLVVAACFSCSGAFLKPLSGPGRVILTATRTGSEENYSRLGEYLAAAIGDPAADLDQDGQTSLLEAWLTAARRLKEFYDQAGRLATEHSLLEDNGDGLGTPSDWFKGTRAVKKAKGNVAPDGTRAGQLALVPSAAEAALAPATRAERDRLEVNLAALRDRKASLPADEYYAELEKILRALAELYRPAS